MMHRTIRPATIAAVAVAAIAAAGLSACGSKPKKSASTTAATLASSTTPPTTPAAASPATVPISLSEYKIQPAVASAAAGRVTFVVTNDGKIKHQLTIIRTDKSAATVLSKQNPDDDIPGARGEISSLAPGATKQLVIKNLKPGHYALVCALPGHYQSGMHVDFTVK